ncbi:MAG: sulfotransferase family 2 domain-containing protein [Oscillatoriales cyanobacterium RM2_1_1]|nr:sulfotransferase family 2 domain-containing protein [Oscillatoriales cyanobacterium SM2_3_0]NJO46147.1 sulfotransferase family 2 domain-containing protein [Oscillatoriales cyanobacterium RM2_1_1]
MKKLSQQFIIFLHIQKTGGITLQRLLRQKFGPSLMTRTAKVLMGKGQALPLEESLKSKQIQDRYFAGHICFGVHRLLPQPFTYITLLREPVSRIISLYDFSRSNPMAFYHKIAVDRTLEEFALSTDLPELDNGQVRFLAGDSHDLFINQTPVNSCEESLLDIAKLNMKNHFSVVGLTEYFDQSMLLMSKVMNWGNCYYLRLNSSSEKTEVSEKIKAKIAERNYLDVLLYKYTKENFLTMLQSYHLDDGKELQAFQDWNYRLNQYLEKPYFIYHRSKSLLRGKAYRP